MISEKNAKALKSAHKVFKFWYRVLLETPMMDDVECRKEYRSALRDIKESYKEK